MSDFNTEFIEEFRSNEGKVGGWFVDKTVLILHTTGAKSGLQRLAPLVYRREGDRRFIFASKGGNDAHPHWYLNLMANPDVTVEVGTDTLQAKAVEVTGAERDAIYARQAAELSNFDDYQKATDRVIPVIELVTTG